MNIQLMALFMGLTLNASAADKLLARDPTQEPRAVIEERPEISTAAPNGWHKEDLEVFTAFLPPGMKYREGRGMDSFTGLLKARN
ncbi:MAG: hypothetical protein M0D55_16060 [Elusimicrobiota bacterium]|nr:MAG: hypothetical protein M0D55_16060 [Elusimicrobiota bacterium]